MNVQTKPNLGSAQRLAFELVTSMIVLRSIDMRDPNRKAADPSMTLF